MAKYVCVFHENGVRVDVQEGNTIGAIFDYAIMHYKHCLKSTPTGWVFAFCEDECLENRVHKIEGVLYYQGNIWERGK